MDSLSWARRGAEVTGVDFSEAAIRAARALSDEVGVPARFVLANVLELDRHLDGAFDVVFTSYGTIGWLPDLGRWAEVVARFLAPGGTFCIAEFHPVASALDRSDAPPALTPKYSYFHSPQPDRDEEDGTYADAEARVENRASHWWNHGLGDLVNALIGAGLRIESLKELARSPHGVHPATEPDGHGQWRLAGGTDSIPLVYVLTATRQEG
jgi:SAM-dependent methyltransferase